MKTLPTVLLLLLLLPLRPDFRSPTNDALLSFVIELEASERASKQRKRELYLYLAEAKRVSQVDGRKQMSALFGDNNNNINITIDPAQTLKTSPSLIQLISSYFFYTKQQQQQQQINS